jgi:hypothetical protein
MVMDVGTHIWPKETGFNYGCHSEYSTVAEFFVSVKENRVLVFSVCDY